MSPPASAAAVTQAELQLHWEAQEGEALWKPLPWLPGTKAMMGALERMDSKTNQLTNLVKWKLNTELSDFQMAGCHLRFTAVEIFAAISEEEVELMFEGTILIGGSCDKGEPLEMHVSGKIGARRAPTPAPCPPRTAHVLVAARRQHRQGEAVALA